MKYLLPLLMISLASPALAQSATTAPGKVKVEKEKKMCRRDVATGSIMPTRTCHTKAEWAAIDAQNDSAADAFRNRPGRGAPNSGF